MKKILQSLVVILLFSVNVYAQNRTVTGTIVSKDDGLPLPGVSVKLKGGKLVPKLAPMGSIVFLYQHPEL